MVLTLFTRDKLEHNYSTVIVKVENHSTADQANRVIRGANLRS